MMMSHSDEVRSICWEMKVPFGILDGCFHTVRASCCLHPHMPCCATWQSSPATQRGGCVIEFYSSYLLTSSTTCLLLIGHQVHAWSPCEHTRGGMQAVIATNCNARIAETLQGMSAQPHSVDLINSRCFCHVSASQQLSVQ